jgi:hypothetical protein
MPDFSFSAIAISLVACPRPIGLAKKSSRRGGNTMYQLRPEAI